MLFVIINKKWYNIAIPVHQIHFLSRVPSEKMSTLPHKVMLYIRGMIVLVHARCVYLLSIKNILKLYFIGPLKTALIDFWEIVCQDQIEQIIILTNLTEQGEVMYLEKINIFIM